MSTNVSLSNQIFKENIYVSNHKDSKQKNENNVDPGKNISLEKQSQNSKSLTLKTPFSES